MRRLVRAWALLAGPLALMLLMTGAALAGGGHQVTLIESSIDRSGAPLAAGEEREIRFSLFQITPIESGTVRLTATLSGSTERITVLATSVGGGDWVASLTFPTEGRWLISVAHGSLGTSLPTALEVGSGPVALALIALVILAAVAVAVALIGAAVRLASPSLPMPSPELQPAG